MVPREAEPTTQSTKTRKPRREKLNVVCFCHGLGENAAFLAFALQQAVERQKLGERVSVFYAAHEIGKEEPVMLLYDLNKRIIGNWITRSQISRLRNYVFLPIPDMKVSVRRDITNRLGITRRTIKVTPRQEPKSKWSQVNIYGEHAVAALEKIKSRLKTA